MDFNMATVTVVKWCCKI